jgi:hypothetical protein
MSRHSLRVIRTFQSSKATRSGTPNLGKGQAGSRTLPGQTRGFESQQRGLSLVARNAGRSHLRESCTCGTRFACAVKLVEQVEGQIRKSSSTPFPRSIGRRSAPGPRQERSDPAIRRTQRRPSASPRKETGSRMRKLTAARSGGYTRTIRRRRRSRSRPRASMFWMLREKAYQSGVRVGPHMAMGRRRA